MEEAIYFVAQANAELSEDGEAGRRIRRLPPWPAM
jgi:hypothetical protein